MPMLVEQANDFRLLQMQSFKGLHGFITFAACSILSNLHPELYKKWSGKDAASIDVLPRSGSERRYFRIHDTGWFTVIGTYGANIKENETFIYFSEHFRGKELTCA